MYQLLIVDDEKEIREGLASWTWGEYGVRVSGSCTHGLEALQFIARHPVDIVMTDIRMPFMDGLALMESLNRHYPFIKIIILSGYSDFDYAKKAIQQGAVDYMLKPVVFSDLGDSIRRLTQQLDEQKQHAQRVEALARKAKQLSKTLREGFLGRLFEMPIVQESLEQEGAEGEVLLEANSYTAAVVRMDRIAVLGQRIGSNELDLIRFSIDNILSDLWDAKQYGYHRIDRDSLDIYLLSKDGDGGRFEEAISQLHSYMGLFKSTFSIGIGVSVADPAVIYQSVQSARKALAGNTEDCAVRYGSPAGELEEERRNWRDASEMSDTEEAQDHIVLVKAMQYMEENYSSSLTMKEVADRAFVSPGHLSALFKKADDTFLKHLTSIRIEKAKELMNDSSYKVYEIAERVGYSDPAYFSELFKKCTGKTPNEYRGKLK